MTERISFNQNVNSESINFPLLRGRDKYSGDSSCQEFESANVSILTYESNIPNEPEFARNSNSLLVKVESGETTSKEGKSLLTKDLCECSALILRNPLSGKYALFHLYFGEISSKQLALIKELGKSNLEAMLIRGSVSRVNEEASQLLEDLKINIKKNIKVETGHSFWDVAYRPSEDKTMINRKHFHELISIKDSFK
ncbi:MAG: hypothetical protein M1355_00265 [Patescibacteria group bacterium]|nr:hypothetical protein [Patescibacteria group bacterium]MCL5093560.1 hypothetical protein [Patescibacteria group bacterium]